MLGLLLARAGVEVAVLEKHADFLRDFRGDTIHPSTLEILDELGLAERFLAELPHTEVRRLILRLPTGAPFGIDFGRLPTRFPFMTFVPQWDFLRFVTTEAARYPSFKLIMEAEVEDLIVENGQVRGVRYRTPAGPGEVRALLTVGADGRTSRVRDAARLPLVETSPPMDALWFRLSRRTDDDDVVGFRLSPGHFFVLINRGTYWQVAFVIAKGAFDQVKAAGLEAFRRALADGVPELADRVAEIQDWDQIKLLTVRADRLRRWYRPGVLCIGDAAHAMTPVAGVGINLAIQDAVEAANVLWQPLKQGEVRLADLARLQRRREIPTRLIQAFQRLVQDRVLRPTLTADRGLKLPLIVRQALQLPGVRDLPARMIALGVLRPHVRTPAVRL